MKEIIVKLESSYMKNINEFSTAIIDLYNCDPTNFFINFINQEFIIDVISLKMTEKNLDFLEESISKVIDITEHKDLKENLLQICLGYFSLFYNLKTNSEQLLKCNFLEKSLVEQVQTLLAYLQDQHSIYQRNNNKITTTVHTGFEKYVSKIDYDKFGDEHKLKISAVESFDANIEIINIIIPFLYYLKGKEIEKNFTKPIKVFPYEDASFEDIFIIAQQRWLLTDLWEKFKYNEWKIELQKTESNEDVFVYRPKNEDIAKANFFGINRINYQINSQMSMSSVNDRRVKWAFKKIENFVANNFDINKILNIDIPTYDSIKIISKKVLTVESKFIDNYYYRILHKDININKLFHFIEYMSTISIIMESRTDYDVRGIDEDFGFLTPIVKIDDLSTSFSRIYNYPVEECREIINVFIFGIPENKGQDLFSKPLVYCGNNSIIICPFLFTHLNITKAIQEWIKQTKVEIDKKGYAFEEQVTKSLVSNQHLKVNTNKLNFQASDGKNIEYDLLAEFDNTVLLIEFKNMFHPYTDKDLGRSLNIIKDGVTQLHRRETVFNSDFHTIKELCNIGIKKDASILKILCTNVYHFTPAVIDDVFITDHSTLIKFFNNPTTRTTAFKKKKNGGIESHIYNYENAWKNGLPKISDLKSFLEKPVSIKLYDNKFGVQYKPIIMTTKTDSDIRYYDMYFIEDPYNIRIGEDINPNARTKTGRNDKCPCGSKKKFKNCCLNKEV